MTARAVPLQTLPHRTLQQWQTTEMKPDIPPCGLLPELSSEQLHAYHNGTAHVIERSWGSQAECWHTLPNNPPNTMQCSVLLGPQRSISQHMEHTQNTPCCTFSLQWFCTHATFVLGNQVSSFPWNISLRCPAGQHREHTSFATCQPQTCKTLHDRGPKLVTWKMISFQIFL